MCRVLRFDTQKNLRKPRQLEVSLKAGNTMGDTFILSPADYPLAYAAFCLKWGSYVLGAVLSAELWRITGARWWLLFAVACALPAVLCVIHYASSGSMPLPTGFVNAPSSSPGVTSTTVRIEWDVVAPLIACALYWAYSQTKRSRLCAQSSSE
jgi:hypothetical protein